MRISNIARVTSAVCLSLSLAAAGACGSSKPKPEGGGGGPTGKVKAEDPAVLADALLAEEDGVPPPVLWSPLDGRIVYVQTWAQEGTGTGLAVVWANPTQDDTRIDVYTPEEGPGPEEGRLAARPKIIAGLKGLGYVRMSRIAWPEDDEGHVAPELEVPTIGKLGWTKDHKLVRVADGATLRAVEAEDPHVPEPVAIDYVLGSKEIALELIFDPGESYGEGFNVYHETHLIRLPAPQ